MSECPVVIIDHFGAPTRLNEADFDPSKHKLWHNRDVLVRSSDPHAGDDETSGLRAEYERLTGRKPDMRWGERRLRDEIAGVSG